MEMRKPNFSDKAKRDLKLIEQALKGDKKAYAELLGIYREPLYFMLLKMVKNNEDAEDLTFEAFEKAFRNLQKYTPNYAFSTWLFKIATNCGIDFIRGQRNRKKYLTVHTGSVYDNFGSDAADILKEQDLNPEEQIIQNQQADAIKELIKSMSPDYRKVILLRYYEGLSYIEISEKLEIPIGTVKTRLFRSKELLETMIKKIPR